MKKFLLLFLIFAVGCAGYVKPSNEETGRVARYFGMREKEVRRLYAKNNFSWDETIREIIKENVEQGESEGSENFSSRLDGEVEKIKTECFLR
ncbi:MAG: hypothetical protein J7L54_01985 [Elusimicrobia bacterium]|nr:hypothetical protein [Elusimicrobiota bacterium]